MVTWSTEPPVLGVTTIVQAPTQPPGVLIPGGRNPYSPVAPETRPQLRPTRNARVNGTHAETVQSDCESEQGELPQGTGWPAKLFRDMG